MESGTRNSNALWCIGVVEKPHRNIGSTTCLPVFIWHSFSDTHTWNIFGIESYLAKNSAVILLLNLISIKLGSIEMIYK